MQRLLRSIMSWGQFHRMWRLPMGMDDESLRLLLGSTWLLLGPASNMLSLWKYVRLIWLAVYYLQFWDALYAPRSSNSSIFRLTFVKTDLKWTALESQYVRSRWTIENERIVFRYGLWSSTLNQSFCCIWPSPLISVDRPQWTWFFKNHENLIKLFSYGKIKSFGWISRFFYWNIFWIFVNDNSLFPYWIVQSQCMLHFQTNSQKYR